MQANSPTTWLRSGASPEDFPNVPSDPDALERFLAELSRGLAGLSIGKLEKVAGRLPGLLGERVPVDTIVKALDSASKSELPAHNRLLLGEIAIDFLILAERWEECVPRLDELVQVARGVGATEELAIVLNYRGVCLYRLAKYPRAKADLEESLRLAERVGNDRTRARARINLGLVLKEMGLLEDAAGHYREALRLARTVGDDRSLLSCYLNVGNIYKDLERWNEGMNALQKGIDLAAKLGESREEVRGRLNMGTLILMKGDDPGRAAGIFRKVISDAGEIGAEQVGSIARSNLALALLKLGKFEESMRESAKSLEEALKGNDPEGVWRAKANLARAHRDLGEFDKADGYFKDALLDFDAIRRSLVSDRDRSEFQRNLMDLQGEFVEFGLESRGGEIAFARLARSKSRALVQAMGNEALSRADQGLDERELLDRVQQTLADMPGTMVLDYFLHKGRLTIFACDAKSVTVHESRGSEKDIKESVAEFAKEINLFIASRGYREGQWGVETGPSDALVELGRILIGPVGERIGSANHLIVVPQGVLHQVPFLALPDEKGRYLVETHALSLLPASDLVMDVRPPAGSGKSRAIVVRGSREGLAGADREIEALKAVFAESCGILDAATEAAEFGRMLAGAEIVHFAGHAEFDRSDPYSSALLLEGGGRLSASDLMSGGMDLSRVRLVALSACETGLGEVVPGDEVISVARAFLAAGASAILVSLWKVSDEATAALMPEFYRGYTSGAQASDALRASIVSLLSKSRVHPYFFAPFNVLGVR